MRRRSHALDIRDSYYCARTPRITLSKVRPPVIQFYWELTFWSKTCLPSMFTNGIFIRFEMPFRPLGVFIKYSITFPSGTRLSLGAFARLRTSAIVFELQGW